ncbi:MAG: rubrerythrin family protein [Eubacteriaceae bacterium]|nr:rubrerythrin family protein [Eubacteriaceae bacterium]
MELKGSKTEANLLAAFAGESQARNKYTFFASQAKTDGYNQIGKYFTETANNEKEHAEMWFKLIKGGQMPTTPANLQEAADGEHFEWSEMYAEFAKVADKEGFSDIAKKFKMVGEIEKRHEDRYLKLLSNIENNTVFEEEVELAWVCMNCGHVHSGKKAPAKCPVCDHPKAYFERLVEDF